MQSILVTSDGVLTFDNKEYRCALGKNGVRIDKIEGDSITPIGIFVMRKVLYRADRLEKPITNLPVEKLQPTDGWCDDPHNPAYNTQITLPSKARHEELWREDGVYDIVVPLSYNDNPPVSGKGSAIFIHITRPQYSPTEGCIALAKEDLLEILRDCTTETFITIGD